MDKHLRLMELLLILCHLLRGKGSEAVACKAGDQEGTCHDIIDRAVIVPQGAVQGKPLDLSGIVQDEACFVRKGIRGLDETADRFLQVLKFRADLDRAGVPFRLHQEDRNSLLLNFRAFRRR